MWRTLVLALLALALAVGVAACGDDDEDEGGGDTGAQTQAQEFPAGSTPAQLQEKGEITIGVKYDVPPFGFKNPQTNAIEGFDVDLGRRIAEAVGAKPKFIEAISDNRIPFLKDGTADLILSTMTITAERDMEIDFSEPYFIARGRILVPQGSDVKGVDDLAGKKVCTALGSTYEETLKKEAPKAELRLVDSYSECLELVQNKAVDAVSTDDVILTGMIIQDDTLELVEGDELTTEPYGVGIKDGDAEMKKVVDDVIAKWKEDGGWAEAYEKWVGQYTGEKQDPPTMTLQEALDLSK
ncbi:MAG TPA: glutamate ABC transporter substrate-binding protein [Solirubrobacteraceae bacterium]|nr:glutamate ABC transporter substrate-binding protein [Solirubrobacteraceae bacterium]